MKYTGRFAPSPTGPLHFGSLVAATASYLEARTHDGIWLLRMEDLDKPREMPGVADDILRMLEAFGFEWDGAVLYQSRREEAYAAAFRALKQQDVVYPCACSRKEISDSALLGIDGPIYPGTCRKGLPLGKTARAWRVRVENKPIVFVDAIQGSIRQNLAQDVGDFVLKRADGLYAYQLAVVVDDAWQGVTHVVRGADLLDSTSRQIYLQHRLNLPVPAYMHVPVAVNSQGEKLSKQTLAQPLDIRQAVPQLWQALSFLGQRPPFGLQQGDLKTLREWAQAHWSSTAVPRQRIITA